MKLVLIFVVFVSLMNSCSSCSRNAANSMDANANVAGESPFAHITDAKAALAEGIRLLDENDTQLAIAALKRAVEIDPDLADAWFQLGIAYSLLEMQMARSGEVTETASNTNTNTKGRVKTNSEKAFAKAVEAYKKLLKANPDDDAALFNLGRTYAKLNKDDDAEEAFRQAEKLKPDDTEYQTELGAVLIKLARYSEAIEPLKKAVELDETNTRAHELLEDAQAGRQRLNYVAPKNTNTANANANSNTGTSSNSNSAPKPANSNTNRKKDDTKKPDPPANVQKPARK